MEINKHILLISYTFPPYPGIGGRRWAKFAKYLAKQGYIVHVICAKTPFKEQSLWSEDVLNENIKRYEVISKYPSVLLSQPITIFQKIKYHLALYYVKKSTKGTPYDRGIFWEEGMIKLASEIISCYNIRNVIVSCAPFSSSYQVLELKKQFKNLYLMLDLRDPWTWGTSYGFESINGRRKLFEHKMEKMVLESYNQIITPSIEMKKHIEATYNVKNEVLLLPHGYDPSEITLDKKRASAKIKIVLYGTQYVNQKDIYISISSIIAKCKSEVELDIYTSDIKYDYIFENAGLLNNGVNVFQTLPPNELFKKICNCDFVLLIQPDYAKDFITTKIYEIIYTKTPIILISKKGNLSEFIAENKLGLCLSPDEVTEKFEAVFKSSDTSFNFNFPIENYSFPKITEKLIDNLITN